MKLSCIKTNLHQGLSVTSHIGTKNVNLPILSNVLLKADQGGLKLVSTNLEIALTCSIRGKVEQSGEYTVPSKLFYDFVSLLPDDRVDIDLHDNGLFISCNKSKTTINGISASEFPLIPPVVGETKYSLSVLDFKKALSQTLFSTALNEARPELTGVYMKFGNGRLTMASTDSYRLSEVEIKASSHDGEHDVIVPQRTLSELNRVFGVFKDDVEASESVVIEIASNQVVFRYGPVELISRTIEGIFPDYKLIIPKKYETKVVVKKRDLQQTIKSVSLFSKQGLYDIKMTTENGALVLSAQDAIRGKNDASLKCDVSGVQNTISLNYKYVLDGLSAINTDEVEVRIIDSSNPFVMMPHGNESEKFIYIVMPIRQ
jgi:DNA polymerase-3 subunit beta